MLCGPIRDYATRRLYVPGMLRPLCCIAVDDDPYITEASIDAERIERASRMQRAVVGEKGEWNSIYHGGRLIVTMRARATDQALGKLG